VTADPWGNAWRRLPDAALHVLLELADLTDDDEHVTALRDELEGREVWREAAQAAYDDTNPELAPPWWAQP